MKKILSLYLALLSGLSLNAQELTTDQLDSLTQLTGMNNHDTVRADSYIKISLILYTQNFDTLFHLNNVANQIAKENLSKEINSKERQKFLQLLSESTNNIAYYYQYTGDMQKAKELFLSSAEIDMAQNNLEGISSTLNNMGIIYNYEGNISLALEYFLRSIKIDEAIGNPEIGQSYNNVAYIYQHQQDTATSLHYYNKALETYKSQGNKGGMAACYTNLGSLHRGVNEEKSMRYFRKAVRLSKEENNLLSLSTAYQNIGNVYLHNELLDSAEYYLQMALELYEEINDPDGVAMIKINLGMIANKNNQHLLARQYGLEAFEIASKMGNIKAIEASNRLLSEAFLGLGNYQQSLTYYKKYHTLKDSLQNLKTKQNAYQQLVKIEFEKQKVADDLERDKSIALVEAEKAHQSKITNYIILIVVIISGLLIFIIYKLLQTRKQKLIIEEKNKENELLLGEIHHRVKNNLQVISSLLSLQEKNISDDTAKKAILEGKERVKSMSLIHKMLYQNDNYAGIEMEQYIQELINGLIDTFGLVKENLQLETNVDNIKLDVDSAVPLGLIINELVINVFKYALNKEGQGTLTVELKKQDDGLHLKIADKGNGTIESLENTNSFGSKLVRSLARQISGEIQVIAESGIKYNILIKDYKLV